MDRIFHLPQAMIVLLAVSFLGCDELVQTNPSGVQSTSGDARASAGVRLLEQRKFAEAKDEFKRALRKPLQAFEKCEVLTMLGNCYNELNEFEESLECHNQAIREDPTYYKAYVNRGIVYRLQGEYDKAAASYAKALELKPDYPHLHANLGTLAVFQGEYDLAIEHLQQAIRLDDTLATAHSNLALAYSHAGRFDEADQELKRAIDLGYHQPEVVRQQIDELRQTAADEDKN